MSTQLENFIKNNKNEFNDLEPGATLWDKVEQELSEKKVKTFSLSFVVRVAAIIVFGMSAVFAIYLKNQHKSNNIDLSVINPAYAEQQIHYTSLIEAKQTELKTIASGDPALYQEFSTEIAKMDSVYQKLNKDLSTSPNQDRVLRAMIRNLQIQIDVLNQQLNIIQHFNQMKKEQHETKNI